MVLLGATFGVVYSCLVEAPALVEYVRYVSPFAARLSLPETFTLITLCVGGGYIMGSLIAKVMSIRHKPNDIILVGILTMLLGNLILMYFAYTNFVNIVTMLGPIAGIFIGVGMISPMAMASAMIPFNNIAGSASAMIGFIQMTLSALSTLLISFFHAKSATPMPNTFIFLIVFGLLVHVCGVSLRPNRQRHYV